MAENTVFEGKKMTRRFLQLLQHSILATIKRLDRLRDEHLFEKRFALAQSDERMIQAFQRNPENYVAVSEVRGYDEDVLKICEDNGIPYHYVDCRSFTENMGGDIIINSDDYPRLLELIKENNKDSIGGADDGDNSGDGSTPLVSVDKDEELPDATPKKEDVSSQDVTPGILDDVEEDYPTEEPKKSEIASCENEENNTTEPNIPTNTGSPDDENVDSYDRTDEVQKSNNELELKTDNISDVIEYINNFEMPQENSMMMEAFRENPENFVAVSESNGHNQDLVAICQQNDIAYSYVEDPSSPNNGNLIINDVEYERFMELVRDHNINDNNIDETIESPTNDNIVDEPSWNSETKTDNPPALDDSTAHNGNNDASKKEQNDNAGRNNDATSAPTPVFENHPSNESHENSRFESTENNFNNINDDGRNQLTNNGDDKRSLNEYKFSQTESSNTKSDFEKPSSHISVSSPEPSGSSGSNISNQPLNVETQHFAPQPISTNNGLNKAIVNATGIKDAWKNGNSIANGFRTIKEYGSLSMFDAATGVGRKAYIEHNYGAFVKSMGDENMAILEKAMGTKLTSSSISDAMTSVNDISKYTQRLGLSKVINTPNGARFLDKTSDKTFMNGKNVLLDKKTGKLKGVDRLSSREENVFRMLRADKKLKGISDAKLKNLAKGLTKNHGKLSDLFGQVERYGLGSSAKQFLFSPNGLMFKAAQQDPTLAQLTRSVRILKQGDQLLRIAEIANNKHLDKQLRALNNNIHGLMGKNQRLEAKLRKGKALIKKEKADLAKQKKRLEELKRRKKTVNKKYTKSQKKLSAREKRRELRLKRKTDKLKKLNKLKAKFNKSLIGKKTAFVRAGSSKLFSPVKFLARKLSALNAFVNKMIVLAGKYILIGLAAYIKFAFETSVKVSLILVPSLLIISFFSGESDSAISEPITQAEAKDADGHTISVFGLIYTELDKEEIEWVTELAKGTYTDSEPPYLKELLLTDPNNIREHRNMEPKDYVEQIMGMKYEGEGIVGPEPFAGAPAEAYKNIKIVDGGHRFEFRDQDGKYGYGSNIKEIMSMTSIATQLVDNTEEGYDGDAEDDGGFLGSIGEFAKQLWTALVNAFTAGVNKLRDAVVPAQLDEWWKNHSKADAIYKRAKISMRYAKPLFDASHEVAFSVELGQAPTMQVYNSMGMIPTDENGSVYGSTVNAGSASSGVFTSDNTPESPSNTYVEGVPAELYILSIAGETGGGKNLKAIRMGDYDKKLGGYHAQGIVQMDNRSNIGDFAAFALQRHPTVWSGYSVYSGMKSTPIITVGSACDNAMLHALKTDFTAAMEDQAAHAKMCYYDNVYKHVLEAGYDLKEHSIFVGAAILSISNRTGTEQKRSNSRAISGMIVNALKAGHSDAQIISALYDAQYKGKFGPGGGDQRWKEENRLAQLMMTNQITINDSYPMSHIALDGNPFVLSTKMESQLNGMNVDLTIHSTVNAGAISGVPTTSYETIAVSYGEICNGNITQSSPIVNSTHNAGCMSYEHFSYLDEHDAEKVYYNGSHVDNVTGGYKVDGGFACVAPRVKDDFVNAYNSNTSCWTLESTTTDTISDHRSGEFDKDATHPSACSTGEHGFSISGGSGSVTVTVYDTWTGSAANNDEETDIIIYKFKHNCAGNHKGYYCGGHLKLVIIGVVTGFTEPEKKCDHTGYTDRADKFKFSNAFNLVTVDRDELTAAKDIFDVDNAIYHPSGIIGEEFEGWSYDNIDWAVMHRGDDADWKKSYNIDSNKKLEDILGAAGYAAFIGDGTANIQNCAIPNIDNGWVDDGALPVIYFQQGGASTWAHESTVPGHTLADSGCSITSLAMATSYLRAGSDKTSNGILTPPDIQAVIAAHNNGNKGAFQTSSGAAYPSIFSSVSGYLGLSCKFVNNNGTTAMAKIIEALKNGNPVIMSAWGPKKGNTQSDGTFTQNGHFIVVTGYCESDQTFTVNDPSHPNNSNKRFTFAFLAKENSSQRWWIISDPNDTASQFTGTATTDSDDESSTSKTSEDDKKSSDDKDASTDETKKATE